MIEKFSDEEIEIIKMELGVPICKHKEQVCREYNKRLREILKDKIENTKYVANPGGLIYQLIDITVNNLKNRKGKLAFTHSISPEIITEYLKMYDEILDIVKKHNRPWEG